MGAAGMARVKEGAHALAGAADAHHFRLFGASKVRAGGDALVCRQEAASVPRQVEKLVCIAAVLVMPGSRSCAEIMCCIINTPLLLQLVIAIVASLAWMTVSSGGCCLFG